MRLATTHTLPFCPPDLFDDERDVLLRLVRELGLAPAQQFVLGEHTARLELLLRDSIGAADVVACSSGTSALTIALHAMGVGQGAAVVLPAFGRTPMAAAVVNLGAVPVFVDVDRATLVVDPELAERALTQRTTVLMPAHVFSAMADMPALRDIADRRGVRLLENSAAAQGAVLAGRPAGLWGDAGVYSFAPVKTFGAMGGGGAVVTCDPRLAHAARLLRDHGEDPSRPFVHRRIGYSSRFDEVVAAFQIHRFGSFPKRLRRRAAIVEYYTERFGRLAEHGVLAPPPGRCNSVYSLLVERRDELRDHLAERGIGSRVTHDLPLPRQPAFAGYAPAGASWPNADRACRRNLAIPCYPHLSDNDVERVADAVCDFIET